MGQISYQPQERRKTKRTPRKLSKDPVRALRRLGSRRKTGEERKAEVHYSPLPFQDPQPPVPEPHIPLLEELEPGSLSDFKPLRAGIECIGLALPYEPTSHGDPGHQSDLARYPDSPRSGDVLDDSQKTEIHGQKTQLHGQYAPTSVSSTICVAEMFEAAPDTDEMWDMLPQLFESQHFSYSRLRDLFQITNRVGDVQELPISPAITPSEVHTDPEAETVIETPPKSSSSTTRTEVQIELFDLYSEEGRIFNLQDDTWYAVDIARTSVNIQVEWNRSDYIDSLGPSARELRERIQVSGTEGKAYASTIEDYVKMCWPKLARFLDLFIDFLLDPAPTQPIDVRPDLTLSMARQEDGIAIRATGDTTDLVRLIQQLAWLATALRRNPDAGRLLAASVTIRASQDALSIRAEPLLPPEEGGGDDGGDEVDVPGSCWLPMFRGRVLARGFPVPARGGEPGVEVGCDVLDLLPGPPWFDWRRCKGGMALVSETAAVVPYRKDGEAGSIRWRYMEASRKELTMDEVERRCAGEVQKTDIWDLWPRREFVG